MKELQIAITTTMKEQNIDSNKFNPKGIKASISDNKNEMVSVKEFEKFDYNIKWLEKDFEMQIFDKETKTVVAIA